MTMRIYKKTCRCCFCCFGVITKRAKLSKTCIRDTNGVVRYGGKCACVSVLARFPARLRTDEIQLDVCLWWKCVRALERILVSVQSDEYQTFKGAECLCRE
jgi:hypothetical protein